jgi:hypothetical protein
MAGLKGGGRYLTGLREHIGARGYVVSSLSTRAGLKKGEANLHTHYTKLAACLIQQAQGKPIRIYAHSLGGIETLDLVKALAARPDLPHKSLEILFISPPGVGQNGLRGLREIGRRFGRLLHNLALYDQYHVLPLTVEEHDGSILQKRQRFLEEWLPYLIPDSARRSRLERTLLSIDAELLFLHHRPELRREYEAWYLGQRHKIMKELLDKVFSGRHIAEDIHQRYLRQYGEREENLASFRAYLRCLLPFLGRSARTLYQGLDAKILEMYEHCRRQGVDTRLGVVVLGKDDLVQAKDYEQLNRLGAARSIPILQHIFQNEEHASVAHKWELIDALEALP